MLRWYTHNSLPEVESKGMKSLYLQYFTAYKRGIPEGGWRDIALDWVVLSGAGTDSREGREEQAGSGDCACGKFDQGAERTPS